MDGPSTCSTSWGDLFWPVAGWTALATLMIGLLTALVWSLKACEKWFCCGCGCKKTGPRDGAQAVDPALRHLPVTPAPAAYAPVTLVGPGSSTAVDTEYFQRQVRGRGTGRRPHDLVLRFPQGAVRMQPDWTQSHSHRPTWAVDKTWPHLGCHSPGPTGPPGESRSHSSLPSRGLHATRGLPLQGVCCYRRRLCD